MANLKVGGVLLLGVILATVLTTSCAAGWKCQMVYDTNNQRRLSCTAEKSETRNLPSKAMEIAEDEDPYEDS